MEGREALNRLKRMAHIGWQPGTGKNILAEDITTLEETISLLERRAERRTRAADRLLAENRRLRESLQRIADGSDYTWGNIARLALEERPDIDVDTGYGKVESV